MNLTTLKKVPKVAVLSACMLASGHLFAQTGFDFGLRGNIQSSTLFNLKDQAAGPELDFVNKVRLAGGIAGGYSFTKRVGLELDVLLSTQGQAYKGDISQLSPANKGIFSHNLDLIATANDLTASSNNYTAVVAVSYIKLPLLFRFNGRNTKRVYFSSFIGPQLDLLSSVKYKINGSDMSLANLKMGDKDGYKKTGVDGVLGLGVGINLTKNLALGVHVRLDFGLGDAENKSATYTYLGTTDKFYDPKRFATNNATGGFLISLDYKLTKSDKTKEKTSTKTTTEKTKK